MVNKVIQNLPKGVSILFAKFMQRHKKHAYLPVWICNMSQTRTANLLQLGRPDVASLVVGFNCFNCEVQHGSAIQTYSPQHLMQDPHCTTHQILAQSNDPRNDPRLSYGDLVNFPSVLKGNIVPAHSQSWGRLISMRGRFIGP